MGADLYFWPQLFGFGDEMQAFFRKNVWWLAPPLFLFLVLGSIAVDARARQGVKVSAC
ncbi:hypothetical protein [Maricaulis sp.]|uniref:hypothetical protein n=1 Tax=Maricaulis sp. TaxID=1486257 RepID=UPI0026073815|nr:hypothetical protein [Maricaulis sp.]